MGTPTWEDGFDMGEWERHRSDGTPGDFRLKASPHIHRFLPDFGQCVDCGADDNHEASVVAWIGPDSPEARAQQERDIKRVADFEPFPRYPRMFEHEPLNPDAAWEDRDLDR